MGGVPVFFRKSVIFLSQVELKNTGLLQPENSMDNFLSSNLLRMLEIVEKINIS
jgi:hypothetical protein